MKKVLLTTLIVAAAASSASAQSLKGLELGLTGGYAAGLSGEAFVHAPNVAGPIGLKASVAVTRPSDSIRDDVSVNPTLGLPTFGTFKDQGQASESGSHTTVGLDGTYNLGEVAPGVSALAYAGGRYGMFSASETYPASGTTTYTMNSFGIGAGAMLSYALAGNISLVGDLGVDQYFDGPINVSGAANDSYSTGDAGYNDVRSRLAFPGTVFKAKLGVKFSY